MKFGLVPNQSETVSDNQLATDLPRVKSLFCACVEDSSSRAVTHGEIFPKTY